MKHFVFSICCMPFILFSQVKSTGIVELGSDMNAKIDLNSITSVVTLTLTGPNDRWFALSFNQEFPGGFGMGEGNDVVWFDGEKLVDGELVGTGVEPTVDEINNWEMLNNTVSGDIRTIIATRAFDTGDEHDYAYEFSYVDMDLAYSHRANASFEFGVHGTSRGKVLNVPIQNAMDNQEMDSKIQLMIFPNPVETSFSISSDVPIHRVRIYNASGENIKDVLAQEIYDLSNFASGIYYLEIITDHQIYYKKLIKK